MDSPLYSYFYMIASVKQVVADVKAGKVFILVDEASRENEGDLVVAAEFITPEIINFMITYGRGGLCLAITEILQKKLDLSLLPKRNAGEYATNFVTSFDSMKVKTGVSVYERERSIKDALKGDKNIICTPGHICPLVAHPKGLDVRKGHTEGSVEVMKIAKLNEPAAVICEILKEDGDMARMPDLERFALKHKINILQIADLITYMDDSEC